MNNLIEFKENGFIRLKDNLFIAFQSINSIEYIKMERDDDYINEKLGLCRPDNSYARLRNSFIVNVKDNKKYSIGYEYGIKLYKRIERTNKFLKSFLGPKYIRNDELDMFNSIFKDQGRRNKIFEDNKNLKLVREELIEKFNSWKGK